MKLTCRKIIQLSKAIHVLLQLKNIQPDQVSNELPKYKNFLKLKQWIQLIILF